MIITVASLKGGQAKTTSAVHIAALLGGRRQNPVGGRRPQPQRLELAPTERLSVGSVRRTAGGQIFARF
jgi:Mrp family chromosome partitioning ATPase